MNIVGRSNRISNKISNIMKKTIHTDVKKIEYPVGLPVAERRLCRKIITAVSSYLVDLDVAIVSCSGGIDSTVLAHAAGQAILIRPENKFKRNTAVTAVYLNHNLRPTEIQKEAEHVESLSKRYLSYAIPAMTLDVPHGSGVQERARTARYAALLRLSRSFDSTLVVGVLTAHNRNDNAETRLFRFLKGKEASGIPRRRKLDDSQIDLIRPFLDFTREDIKRYAESFKLSWCEDSSNAQDHYTRNRIRHHLIPWIKENVNPGIIKTLT